VQTTTTTTTTSEKKQKYHCAQNKNICMDNNKRALRKKIKNKSSALKKENTMCSAKAIHTTRKKAPV